MKFNEAWGPVVEVCSNKKFQWIASILALFFILIISSNIRMSNWDSLTDSTTGEKIPLALDPYYFLRISETLVETGGDLPEVDEMRGPGFETGWSHEILPNVVIRMWKVANLFGDYSLGEINVFSPVLFYGIGLILFFILTYLLTRSKAVGVLGSLFLALNPTYLYRTMAGFSDHEAIGMVGFFAVMIVFVLAMRYLDGAKKIEIKNSITCGIILGAFSLLSILTWGGVATFIFMIFPISFLFLWIVKLRNEEGFFRDNGLVFYITWITSFIIFSAFFRFGLDNAISKITSSNGIFTSAVLGFIIIDRLFLYYGKLIKQYKEKYRLFYSGLTSIVLGSLALPLIGKNIFSLLWEILNRLMNPTWGTDRVGTTVAENAQPYLVSWIGTAGAQVFWLFVLGIIMLAWQFSKNIKSKKNKYLMIFGIVFMSSGILFSRISADSIMNGSGLFSLSGLFYLTGLAAFAYTFFKNYFSSDMKIDSTIIILFIWMFVMLIVGRSTTRLFFVIAPLMCLLAGYSIVKLFEAWNKNNLEEISKVLVIGLLLVSVITGAIGAYASYNSISYQAQYTGPSANAQWQNAMEWVRENTAENGLFSHWWDYGYWVQTLGERPTVADGGHFQGIYDGNHKLGRYVLTTPYPETALSFFKTLDVDYLLIDQTDLGKYSAYSSIGGGNDEAGESGDRYAAIPVMPLDEKQTVETSNGTMFIFSGGMYLFEDINYNFNGKNVFLPANKAAVLGIILGVEGGSLTQPEVVYMYNGIQTRLPARYVYMNGQLVDFGDGLEVVIRVIPSFTGSGINSMGAAIYLSQKVSKSLFARLYLLDDAFGEYETLELVHSEDDQVVAGLKAQGAEFGDFIYYQGFRGPIKIWDVSEIPETINAVEEFKEGHPGEYGSLDNLDFGQA